MKLLVHDPGLFDSMKVSPWAGGGWLRSQQLEGGVRGRRDREDRGRRREEGGGKSSREEERGTRR